MRKYLILTAVFLAAGLSVYAQDREAGRIRFDYDVKLSTKLDNREYDRTDLDESCTLFGARAQVGLGISIGTDSSVVRHRLLGGLDPLYEFGGPWTLQPLLYYQMTAQLKRSRFSLVAGAFPRSKSTAYYSDAFFSQRTLFLNDTYDGAQFSWLGENFQYEFGVDWMGMIGKDAPARREEFMVYSGGHHRFPHGLKLAYSAYLHHYACSFEASNVVDDILVNPYVEYDAGRYAHVQTLMGRLGYVQAFQRDRAATDKLLTPGKGEFYFEVRNWNVGIVNDVYFGGDMMPYFNETDPAGVQYGTNLYMGDRFLRNPEGQSFGVYDKLSVYYEPFFVKKLTLRVQLDFHFNGGYAGWRQVLYVAYQL